MRCGRLVRRVRTGLATGLLAVAAAASAQTTGSIVGKVLDSSGAPLPGVTVEASSASLQGVRARATGAYGEYRFPALPPGEYRVRAVLEGFRPAEKVVRVAVGSSAAGDLTLSLTASERVKVTGEVPFVDTSSTTSSTTYLAAIIRYLPCGRDYASVVKASPGVATDRGASQMRSLALAIRGATSAENLWNVDGVNSTDVQRGIQGKAVNSEFVEEVQVMTGGYQAEYGRSLGGIVNVVTKAGGNAFHGEGFVYYDASATAARPVLTSEDEVTSTMRLVDYTRRDFGADLGGYLLKDRLWFFAAYDRVSMPAEVSPNANSPDGTVTTSSRFPLDATTNLYSGKLTWNAAAGTSVIASVVGDPTTNSGAGAADPRLGYGSFVAGSASGPQPRPITSLDPATWETDLAVGGVDYGVRATQLFGSHDAVEGQAGVHHDRFQLTAPGRVKVQDFTCSGGTPDSPCTPPGEPTVSGGYGYIYGPIQNGRSHRSQVRLDWTHYAGDHTLKAGADYQRAATESSSQFTGGQRVDIFNEEGVTYYHHTFFSASAQPPFAVLSSSESTTTIRDIGGYLEDSWKPAAWWTVNAGLRWDREGILDPRFAAFIQTQKFQPRVGVIWDPGHDGRSKIYAFAGRFFWGLPSDVGARNFSFNDFYTTTSNFSSTDVAPDPGDAYHAAPPGGEPVDSGLKAMYQDEASVGVEHQFTGGLSVGLTATYRRLGNSIEDRCDLDGSRPETNYNTCAMANPGSNGRIARGDVPGCDGLDRDVPQCYDTIPAMPRAKRVYKGIELVARQSLGSRLWLQASYVYSSLRGNYDGAINQSSGQTDPGINVDFDYYLFDHNLEGRLFLDQPHRFRLDGYYMTPLGIAVGMQAFVASGVPLDKLGFFNVYYGAQVNLVPRGSAGRMPTQWDANLSLAYPIPLGPATVTLQAYVFNLFNNQIPTYRRTDWSTLPPSGYPDLASLYDPNQESTNPDYGKVVTRMDPRVFRGAIRISF